MNRLVLAALCAVALVIVVGCQPQQRDTGVPAKWTSAGETSATADGVSLAVAVRERKLHQGSRFEVVATLAGISPTPVTLKTPDGSLWSIEVRSVDTSQVVFDSRKVDGEAQASVPDASTAEQSETLEDGVDSESTYQFTVAKPGHYVLTARTFGPVVTTQPLSLTVQ